MFDFSIHNFRGFLKQDFKFSRINILIGENNGGKSSLLKFLLALKQTIDNPLEVNLKLSGDYTDLGNFEEVVYNRNKRRKIIIKFSASNSYHEYCLKQLAPYIKRYSKSDSEKIKKKLSTYKGSKTEISIEFSSKLDEHSSLKTILRNSKIGQLEILQIGKPEQTTAKEIDINLQLDFNGDQNIVENCTASKEGFFTIVNGLELEEICKSKFEKLHLDYFFSIAYLLIMQNFVKERIDKLRFVNPIGTSPKRFYFKEDKKANYKLIDIEKFINILGDNNLAEKSRKALFDIINNVVYRFGIAEEIALVNNKQLPIIALNVKTKDFWSNITDVGYGVSLQLPILFQAILSEYFTDDGETILIEQPEVHLHPTLQAKFIETLLSIGENNSYFIETHSEHIIRKLQVLVKQGSYNIKPEDITIHYFKRDQLKFEITKHQILENGKLEPHFPNGFFDTTYTLVKELL
jgi:predicted ATPase